MFEGNDSMFNAQSVPSNISYKSLKTSNIPTQNSYCGHRNFDSVNQPRESSVQDSTNLSVFNIFSNHCIFVHSGGKYFSLFNRGEKRRFERQF